MVRTDELEKMNVMEKRLIIICAFCAAAMAAGCSKADIAPERQNNGGTAPSDDAALSPHQVISAALPGTRTSLSGSSVLWSAGDRISLFNEGGEPCTYTLIGEGGSTTGSFEAEGTPEEGYMYAVYPELQGRPDGKTAVTCIAESQNYDAGEFPATYPMAAVSSDGESYSFRNLAAILKLSIVGDAEVRSVSIEALGGEKLAGNAVVDFSSGTPGLSVPEENSSGTVTLVCSEPVRLTSSATDFLFVVAPGTYGGGFRITVTDTDSRETSVTTSAVETEFKAGTVKNFGGTLGIYSSGFENIYILGDGTYYSGWDLGQMAEDPAPKPDGDEDLDKWTSKFTHSGNGVYTWSGILAPGTFKMPWAESFDTFFGVEDGRLVYHPEATPGYDPKFTIETAGNYTITIDIHKLTFDLRTESLYEVPSELYLVGDGTSAGWTKTKALPMKDNGNGVFSIETELTSYDSNGGFKFVFNNDDSDDWSGFQFAWALNKIWQGGMDRKYDACADAPGRYRIEADTVHWTYKVERVSEAGQ